MTAEARRRATAGLALFVALSFLGSWFVAAALRVFELNVAPGAIGTRLFTTSLLYAITMGWQPLLATYLVRRWIDPPDAVDLGLRPARRIFSVVGAVAALGFVVAALALAWGVARLGHVAVPALHGSAEAASASAAAGRPSASALLALPLAFAGTLVLLWLQAFTEEVGWRGYFLPRAMERLGRWPGLFLHGAVWGAWYAPVLFFTSYGPGGGAGSLGKSLAFVVTCVLVGTLLGWLRLASRSLAPVIVANAALTLGAGLPYVVHGLDAGLRAAALGPAGWALLALAIAALARSRFRLAVQTPARLVPLDDAAAPPASPFLPLRQVWSLLEAPRRGGDRDLLN
jgi:membrane protease YdiL (CAAX protease family)